MQLTLIKFNKVVFISVKIVTIVVIKSFIKAAMFVIFVCR